jgi:hypothetical protein
MTVWTGFIYLRTGTTEVRDQWKKNGGESIHRVSICQLLKMDSLFVVTLQHFVMLRCTDKVIAILMEHERNSALLTCQCT